MTKEQFYKNCLTSEGKSININMFAPLTLDGSYYKNTKIDVDDMRQWNEIVYLSRYGKVITWEALIDSDKTNEYGEILPDETYGQTLDMQDWEVLTMWDILQRIVWYYENGTIKNKKDIKFYHDLAIKIYHGLNGEDIGVIIKRLSNEL